MVLVMVLVLVMMMSLMMLMFGLWRHCTNGPCPKGHPEELQSFS